MTAPPLIVVSLEGLAASAISCYGSSWNATPAVDRLASTGCLWDRLLATSDQPAAVFANWTGRNSSWADAWRKVGPVELITDCDASALPETCFDEILSVPPKTIDAEDQPASDIVDTQFGQLIAAAIERDSQSQPWGVLWIHSQFLTRCWDAPRDLSLAEEHSDELDFDDDDLAADDNPAQAEQDAALPPDVFPGTTPPQLKLAKSCHPDLITSWMKTYGCQVRLVDLLVEILLETVQVPDPTVLIAGTSGFRLGQGGYIGHRSGPMRSPDVRLPLIINRGGPLRLPHLTPSGQLESILGRLAATDLPVCASSNWSAPLKRVAPIQIDSDRAQFANSTPDWFYVMDRDNSEHLFLKPDDIDDFNDVGRLRGDVVESLRSSKKNDPSGQ